jgi:hypothetical protein
MFCFLPLCLRLRISRRTVSLNPVLSFSFLGLPGFLRKGPPEQLEQVWEFEEFPPPPLLPSCIQRTCSRMGWMYQSVAPRRETQRILGFLRSILPAWALLQVFSNRISCLLGGFMGVPIYKKDRPLAFRLRLPIQNSSVLFMKLWVEILNPLQQVIRLLTLSFVLRATLAGLGKFLASVRRLQTVPWSQPVIVNGPNESLTRLLIRTHVYLCPLYQSERPQAWQFSFRNPTKHHSQFFQDVILSSTVTLSSV